MLVSIVGLGRMGSLLAEYLALQHSLILFDIDREKAGYLAQKLHGRAALEIGEAASAAIIILALEEGQVVPTAEAMVPALTSRNIIVNIATTLPKCAVEQVLPGDIQVVSVKLVGHALEIRLGERPVVVVDGSDLSAVSTVSTVFKGFGDVVRENEDKVAKVNTLAAAEGIRAALRIRRAMEEQNLPQDWWETAVRLVAAGTMKAFAKGDAGPFAQRIIEEVEGREK